MYLWMLPRLPSFVERVALTPQVKLDLHLRRYPHSGNSELFLLNGLAGTDRDLPRIVHAVRSPVCTENLIRVADVMESPKLAE